MIPTAVHLEQLSWHPRYNGTRLGNARCRTTVQFWNECRIYL